MSHPERWKQRFENFENAFLFLEKGIQQKHYTKLEEGGLIQAFEFTFELAWKTLKDKLELEGIKVSFPRQVLKQAFQGEYLQNGKLWMRVLEERNTMAHVYNEKEAQALIQKIKIEYYPAFKDLYTFLKNQIDV